MKHCARLVTSLVVICLLGETLGISLPSILSFSAKEDSVENTKDSEEAVNDVSEGILDRKASEDEEKRPPLVPAIPHPADTNLNPLNNPSHPLHPDNLPHLPHLPHFTRETIHATKTVFVEVTDRVTIHPVCVTAHKLTPPCLPYNPHHGGSHYHHRGDEVPGDLQAVKSVSAKVPQIQPSKAAVLSEATRAEHQPKYIQLVESNRYIGGESISDLSRADVSVLEGTKELSPEGGERGARYMEITPYINPAEEVQIKDEPTEYSAFSPLQMVNQLLHLRPVTHYKTKTLWVTKVEKVLDTRVTATLLAKNCVPTNSHIPNCSPHHGVFGPGYHGQYGQNGHHTYTEVVHGHGHGQYGHSGSFTEKAEEYRPEDDDVEQRAADSFEYLPV